MNSPFPESAAHQVKPQPSAVEISPAARYVRRMEDAAEYLRARIEKVPEIAIVLGSGLGSVASTIEAPAVVPFSDIPSLLPSDYSSKVEGHKKEFVFGSFGGKAVVAQSGRLHMHEGLSAPDVSLPVRVLATLGVKTFIISNAAGGLDPAMKVGDIMILTNHLSFGVPDPSLGVSHPAIGHRFYDVSNSFDPELIRIALEESKKAGLTAHRGAYFMKVGPSYETAGEIQFLAAMGRMVREAGRPDDAIGAVGMSTAPEVHALRNYNTVSPGIRILGISLITNLAAGISSAELSHDEVQETGRLAESKMREFVRGVAARL